MKSSKKLTGILLVPLAALLGNWLGGWLRFLITGQHVSSIQFVYVDSESGRTYKNSPVFTKFYPAVMLAFVGKPGWLFALLGGVATGAFLDDRIERKLWDRLVARVFNTLLDKVGEAR